MTMDRETHYDIIRKIADEGWDFNQNFVRELLHSRPEYKEKSGLAYAFGAKAEKTGKHFCPDCDRYFTEVACFNFEDIVRDTLKREVIRPYIQKHCPKCEEKLEECQTVHEADFVEVEWDKEGILDFDTSPDVIEKTKYEPCGCLFEIGEEEILWDLDKEKVRDEVKLLNYSGPIFDG